MKIFNHIHKPLPFNLKLWGMLLIMTFGVSLYAHAQLIIGGNVYGGGDKGNVGGSTSVQVISGDMEGSVFGGARMANVGGSAFVDIDGVTKGSSDYTVIDRVYGGNDISGTIGTAAAIPTKLNKATEDEIDNTWNAFVHISDGGTDTDGNPNKKIYIGQLFGGGNGEYDYNNDYAGFVVPDLKKTYVDIQGGSIVYAYGGGNNATVTESTVIRVDNPSQVVNHIIDERLLNDDINTTISAQGDLLTNARFKDQMGINTGLSYPSSDAFQIGRLFGGNNMAEMTIRPLWHLQSGKVRNLYSGGNRGMMSSSEGLLLTIEENSTIKIDNLYGGCRMADVRPLQFDHNGEHILDANGNVVDMDVIQLTHPVYTFPAGFSARTVVSGGDVNNIYGGNDVTGRVYGGNAVGLYTSIRGNLYGGGNGSYPYTDNPALKNHDIYGDLYYNPDQILADAHITVADASLKSATALNEFRPDAEQVSIHLIGKTIKNDQDEDVIVPTIIGGSVYCGGNSATIRTKELADNALVELKIGSYVIADNVFMGNNGENMVDLDILKRYAGSIDPQTGELSEAQGAVDFSSMDLKNAGQFATYMDGAAMDIIPSVTFDSKANGLDRFDYVPYSTYFGSFYCGGNVGSMTYAGTNTMDMLAKVNVFNKLVGGCNSAYVVATDYNAEYDGGLLGTKNEDNYTGNRLVMNIEGPRIEPRRWDDPVNKTTLVWNTYKWDDETDEGFIPISVNDPNDKDADRRILGGNIYGGCYNSGHVNGNIVININDDLVKREEVFADVIEDPDDPESLIIDANGNRNSGVILDEQAFDVNAVALTVFGAGKGLHTEIWGSTTVNLNKGYAFQIFGGGEEGVVGKGTPTLDANNNNSVIKDEEGYPVMAYAPNPAYSTTVNLSGESPYYPGDDDMPQGLPQSEYLYGGGNEGDVCGNSTVYLGNGYIYDAFGGASNANILGHAQVFIGRQINSDGNIVQGFPWVTDIVYGGNDFGGRIEGKVDESFDYTQRVRDWDNDKTKIYGYDATNSTKVPKVLRAAAYVEYLQGSVDTIFGGAYGNYDYYDPEFYVDGQPADMPFVHSTFVNFRPDNVIQNNVNAVFGGNTGYPDNRDGDKSLEHSYVLIDIPYANVENYRNMEIFGSGSYGGLGMREEVPPMAKPADNATDDEKTAYSNYLEQLDEASAVIDLIRGKVGAAYGGSFNEGITRRSVVNVPEGSTIDIGSIFGGAYGNVTLSPCDVYEANVNYHSADAILTASPKRLDSQTGDYVGNDILRGAIYGGNNNRRRTLYSKINIDVPVRQNHWNYGMTTGTVYGAGCGENTWAEYTEVNLLPGAQVYEVYGGGEDGLVINAQSIQKYINEFATVQGLGKDASKFDEDLEQWKEGWTLGAGLDDGIGAEFNKFTSFTGNTSTYYRNNPYTNLNNPLVRKATEYDNGTYNTNVIINKGATVNGYAYGGGLGHNGKDQSGNIYGTTYIALLGGTVSKDLYAAGTTGAILDAFGVGSQGEGGYTASTTAYIEGGTVRNVYGGGWEGNVGYHDGAANNTATEMPGRTNVVIGIRPELTQDAITYYKGDPAIQRNAYAGGEGGSVIGQANITINNGHIGYIYLDDDQALDATGNIVSSLGATAQYVEKVDDETYYDKNDKTNWLGKNRLEDYGNVFGSGFDDLSSVDESNVTIYGGTIRNSVFGGGEIATIGRGKSVGELGQVEIYKAGKTHIYMYNGLVKRNVFGGGKGYNKLGYGNSNKLYTQGYVFGQTDVNIYGGEIGTTEGIAQGDGNVFGGGDQGFVFSAYEYPNNKRLGLGKKYGERYDDAEEGYYYKTLNGVPTDNNGNTLSAGAEKYMTEDCHVLIEPWLQVKTGSITDGTTTYNVGDYVPTSYLNTLPKKAQGGWTGDWTKLDVGDLQRGERGILIHNAVFAGGNVSSGSDISANIKTVYGNATASINDIYHRDMITVGTGRVGGLYGDGNLTFVDGYRELNITNYGTDYYHIKADIDINTYRNLPDREKAYYELKYKCMKECIDIEGTKYTVNSSIPQDQLVALFTGVPGILDAEGTPNEEYWVESGILLRAPGRTMNTLQRADFCGVFGSRLVMQGARDRVPEVVDYTNYTINRVREVSLNKCVSTTPNEDDNNKEHGNYFGIYSVVNYLGALTSDVDFGDENNNGAKRVTENIDAETYKSDITIGNNTYDYDDDEYTYYNWKKAHYSDRIRNNGSSHNQVALASGVYLELTNEKVLTEENTTGNPLYDKDWGIITGVVELDLINVSTGLGGGFVYAKNVHGTRSNTGKRQTTLSALNAGAETKKKYRYSSSNSSDHWESSGNFVHSTQTIIDDCYNMSGLYYDDEANQIAAVPAHYWFIKGQIYIYDQVISAYTGAPNAYSEQVNIPLTISAGANGRMKLVDVQPNRYAYYQTYNSTTKTPLTATTKLVLNDATYNLNDPISYWDWQQLSNAEKQLFVPETYVVIEDCKIGDTEYKEGTVLLESEYNALFVNNAKPTNVTHKKLVDGVQTDVAVDFDYVFRSSNNLSHNTGYILTYNVDNPLAWDKWYTPIVYTQEDNKKVDSEVINSKEQAKYQDGPTYTPTHSGLYGQSEYGPADIISKEVYDKYNTAWDKFKATSDWTSLTDAQKADKQATQAEFERAYLTTAVVDATKLNGTGAGPIHLQKGTTIALSEYSNTNAWPTELSNKVKEAFVCTSTIKLSETEYITAGDLLTNDQIQSYLDAIDTRIASLPEGDPGKSTLETTKKEINKFIVEAYYCTSETKKLYGGDYYETGHNYRALNAWSAMSESDREFFTFNYDALDLLIDPTYSGTSGKKYQYDYNPGEETPNYDGAENNPAHYSLPTALDYTAQYFGAEPFEFKAEGTETMVSTNERNILTRIEFESLPNEQNNYAPIKISSAGSYYIVKEEFVHNEPYTVGQTISEDTYKNLTEDERTNKITVLTFGSSDINNTLYFCRKKYTINESYGKPVRSLLPDANDKYQIIEPGNEVPIGFIINQEGDGAAQEYKYGYLSLVNKQKYFTIHGKAPVETSTLYVSRNSDIFDLSQEKIITVVYQYDYEESDETATNITPVSERHVVNIHLQFKSGIPTIDNIMSPDIVLPGTSVSLRTPEIAPGAYEIIDRGWELFERESFAESHVNGMEYTPSADPLYWYQDGYYVAYYAKTYLGKTYSNYVPVSVANYHDLRSVMADKENHMFVDYDRTKLKRNSKIYINDYSSVNENGLDLLKDLFDLTLITTGSPKHDDDRLVVDIPGSHLDGHTLLNTSTETGLDLSGKNVVKGVKHATNLDFILRTNLDHSGTTWASIGSADDCFNGTLHGDGYTISGLSNSLFANLCGDVYNLGVTGTFTGAGIADSGDGYIENSWISTTSTLKKTSKPILGNITRDSEDDRGPVQIVNSYYMEEDLAATTPASDNEEGENHMVAYTNYESNSAAGTPIRKTELQFYNGEVAHSLNGFYLNRRYYNGINQGETANKYHYIDSKDNNSLKTIYYPVDADAKFGDLGYVEDRYSNGDYRFAAGSTEVANDKHQVFEHEEDAKPIYVPVWPDDYIYFGQNLTFGYDEHKPHQSVPSHYYTTATTSNRVYRAPAYFGNSNMSEAYFNPDAILPATNKSDASKPAYLGMTAIDFTGYNNRGYVQGLNGDRFYTPWLDFDGLRSLRTDGQTQNLLAYVKATDETTVTIIDDYFVEPEYALYANVLNNDGTPTGTANDYMSIRRVDDNTVTKVRGHLVLLENDVYHAAKDQFLVDKQDFNAPISYIMGSRTQDNNTYDNIIWYQRTPEVFVRNAGNGWESISLPFTAKTVTTSQKGWITHFYQGSKIGHEYWLRTPDKMEETSTQDKKVLFKSLAKASADDISNGNGADITYTNRFLYDYYYSKNSGYDANTDTYHQEYYSSNVEYAKYPYAAATQPYLIGFPSERYYEFDMSGNFEALNTTAPVPDKLDKQTITFVSDWNNANVTINISDNDYQTESAVQGTAFRFKPTYQTKELSGADTYLLNDDGTAFLNDNNNTVKTVPFRAYFVNTSANGARTRSAGTRAAAINALYIGYAGDQDDLEDVASHGGLFIYGQDMSIYIESSLEYETQVTITTVAGKTLKQFTIQPGTKVQVPVNSRGVYIVNHKKIAVTK